MPKLSANKPGPGIVLRAALPNRSGGGVVNAKGIEEAAAAIDGLPGGIRAARADNAAAARIRLIAEHARRERRPRVRGHAAGEVPVAKERFEQVLRRTARRPDRRLQHIRQRERMPLVEARESALQTQVAVVERDDSRAAAEGRNVVDRFRVGIQRVDAHPAPEAPVQTHLTRVVDRITLGAVKREPNRVSDPPSLLRGERRPGRRLIG